MASKDVKLVSQQAAVESEEFQFEVQPEEKLIMHPADEIVK